MVLNEKLAKNLKLRGLKLRGLMRNQLNTPRFRYENDQRKNKIPTHMAATHAISKSKRNFQNRIPSELDKNFYIPRISMTH